jgi:hypothetical protein
LRASGLRMITCALQAFFSAPSSQASGVVVIS